MVKIGTRLGVGDNSGAKEVECIRILRSARTGVIGSIIVVAVKDAISGGKVKKGEVYKAVIVRCKYPLHRNDGSSIKFDSNDVVMISDQLEPIGTRVFGPIPRELRGYGMSKLISLAPEVL